MTITAIETRYAGCRFRSRLEARWAVFFDRLRIRWEYEPQGYLIGAEKRGYLPDFKLPDLNIIVEVKGDAARLDLNLLTDALAETGYYQLIILGSIPRPVVTGALAHHALISHTDVDRCWHERHRPLKGQLREPIGLQWITFLEAARYGAVSMPIGPSLERAEENILDSRSIRFINQDPSVRDAYAAARSARFEHGESGAPTPGRGSTDA